LPLGRLVRKEAVPQQEHDREADRQIDEEDPAPAELGQDQAAQVWPDDRAHRNDRREQADESFPLMGGVGVDHDAGRRR